MWLYSFCDILNYVFTQIFIIDIQKNDYATGKLFHKYLPSHDKKIGEEGFDLGTEILDQSRQLKISGAEKITDKVIEEKDSKNNNTKDNK